MTSTLTRVRKRDGTLRPFEQERIMFAIHKAAASVGGRDLARAKRLSDRVVMTLEDRFREGEIPTVEQIQDLIEEVLITAGHVATARSFIVYRETRRAARSQSKGASRASFGPVPYRTLWDTLTWNLQHGCHSASALRETIGSERIDSVIEQSEDRFDEELRAVAEQIAAQRNQLKIVIVAGPSSSGKTTTTERLRRKLARRGINLTAINVDNYYRDLSVQPRDQNGDYDYETPEAIDLPLLNDHLEKLITGHRVLSPSFDFHSGTRTQQTVPVQMGPDDLLLLDTLHGLYKGLTDKIPDEVKYKVYIESLFQLMSDDNEWVRWTDIRLMRRMTRDAKHRNKSPQETLEHWHYVRRSEKKHILPTLGDADFVLNGSLPYEICLYRSALLPFFESYVTHPDGHPEDALERAIRAKNLLQSIPSLEDRPSIPKWSVLREFIGGGLIQ